MSSSKESSLEKRRRSGAIEAKAQGVEVTYTFAGLIRCEGPRAGLVCYISIDMLALLKIDATVELAQAQLSAWWEAGC